MKTIRAVIAGSGMMGAVHADALRRIPGVVVCALADINPETGRKVAQTLGIPKFYLDYKQMLQEEQPDVIHICTPNFLHFEIAEYALSHGVGVYCEKPLALNSEQGEKLARHAKKAGLPNGVNFNYRSNAMVRDMRERICTGESGEIYLIYGHYLQDWLMYPTDYSWRLDPERNGISRAVADIGSHWFDTAQFVSGRKIQRVYAKLNTAIPERIRPSAETKTFEQNSGDGIRVPIGTEDIAIISLEFEGGIPGSLILSQVSGGHKNDLQLDVDCAAYAMHWEQENADKLWVSSRMGGNQLIYASAGTVHPPAARFAPLPEGHGVAWKDALYNSISEFYRAAKEQTYTQEPQSYVTFETGAQILKLVDACLRSNELGTWVEV